MKFLKTFALAVLLALPALSSLAAGSNTAKVHFEPGSKQETIESGGSIEVKSGGTILIDSGGTISNNGSSTGGNIAAGGGSGTFKAQGLMKFDVTSNGNAADTSEDTLTTYSLPASTLNAAGKALHVHAWGIMAANGDTKTVKCYFGANVISSPAAATNNKNWVADLWVVRNGASTQVVNGTGIVDTTAITPYSATGSETETGAITIKCTGTAGTGNANDIVQKGLLVQMMN